MLSLRPSQPYSDMLSHLLKRRTGHIALDKALFQPKSICIFLISRQKHMLWYSLEAPRLGASNEYP